MSFTLKKQEILKSKKTIKELFDNGSSFFLYPFKVYFLPSQSQNSNQVLFSVSKKYFKKAVDRNLIRRRMKEVYRLKKGFLNYGAENPFSLSIALLYVSRFKLPFSEIEFKLKQVFVRLNKTEENKLLP